MRFLVTGAKGMLGTDLVSEIQAAGHDCVATDRDSLDVCNPSALQAIADGKQGKFDWIINCAAYTAVDQAETDVALATRLNVTAPALLAMAARLNGARLLHISTDYVFDGLATYPYKEDAPTHPLSVYGRTKLAGEHEVLNENPASMVVRTSWLFGAQGKCFPRSIIGAYLSGKDLRVVSDQRGCPTYTVDLARTLIEVCCLNAPAGTYHACGPEAMSWFDFASLVLTEYCIASSLTRPFSITPIATTDWPTPAQRPLNSVLDCSKVIATVSTPQRPIQSSVCDFVRSVNLP